MCWGRTVYGEQTQDSKPSLSGYKADTQALPYALGPPCRSPADVPVHTHGFLHLYLMVLSTQRECAQLCRGGKNFILLLWVSTGAPIAKDRLTREKTSLFHVYHTCNIWEYWEMGNSKNRLRTLGYIVSSTKNNKFVEKWQDKGKWFLAPKGGKLRR